MFKNVSSNDSKKQALFNQLLDSLNNLEQKEEEDSGYLNAWGRVLSTLSAEDAHTVIEDFRLLNSSIKTGDRYTVSSFSNEIGLRVMLLYLNNDSPALCVSSEDKIKDCDRCDYMVPGMARCPYDTESVG